jgi:histidine ammonia-lyase
VRSAVEPLSGDRSPQPDVAATSELLANGRLERAVEAAIDGSLE